MSLLSFILRTRQRRCAFSNDERGQITILFALLLVVMAGFAGTAIDVGRAYEAQETLQAAIDSATEAGSQRLGQPREQVASTISAYLKANLPPRLGQKLVHEVVIGDNDEYVTVRMNDHIDMTFAKLLGYKRFELKAEATARRPALVAAVPAQVKDALAAATGRNLKSALDGNASSQEDILEARARVLRDLEQALKNGRENDVRDLIRALSRR